MLIHAHSDYTEHDAPLRKRYKIGIYDLCGSYTPA